MQVDFQLVIELMQDEIYRGRKKIRELEAATVKGRGVDAILNGATKNDDAIGKTFVPPRNFVSKPLTDERTP